MEDEKKERKDRGITTLYGATEIHIIERTARLHDISLGAAIRLLIRTAAETDQPPITPEETP